MAVLAEDVVHSDEPMTQLVLRYQGPAVEDGLMNVYDVTRNLIAFSDFVVMAAHAIHGNDVNVRAEVRAFQRGSFTTDVVFTISHLASIWPLVSDIAPVVKVVKESIGLFKFLKGKAPTAVENHGANSVVVQNNNGSIQVVNIASLHLTLNDKAASAVEGFIAKPLGQPGITAVSIGADDDKDVAEVERQDRAYFSKIESSNPVTETTARIYLVIEAPSFKDGNKWRFNDGGSSSAIAIADEDFLQRVDKGEPFRKGDVLVADVKITQHQAVQGGPIRTERVIVKVVEHQARANDGQASLFRGGEFE